MEPKEVVGKAMRLYHRSDPYEGKKKSICRKSLRLQYISKKVLTRSTGESLSQTEESHHSKEGTCFSIPAILNNFWKQLWEEWPQYSNSGFRVQQLRLSINYVSHSRRPEWPCFMATTCTYEKNISWQKINFLSICREILNI